MPWEFGHMMWWPNFFLGPLISIIFWVIIIFLIISLFKKDGKEETKALTPMDILKERYAKGEVSKKEYEEKKKDILKD